MTRSTMRHTLGPTVTLAVLLAAACGHHLDCEEAEDATSRLLGEFGACARDDECRVLHVAPALQGANDTGICIRALVCSVAIRADADERAFVARARDIVSRRRCDSCTAAKCARPEALAAFCDPTDGRCRIRRAAAGP